MCKGLWLSLIIDTGSYEIVTVDPNLWKSWTNNNAIIEVNLLRLEASKQSNGVKNGLVNMGCTSFLPN